MPETPTKPIRTRQTKWMRATAATLTGETRAVQPANVKTIQLAPNDLASILSPVDPSQFLAFDWGQQFRHIRGAPGKFSALLPWHVLNGILEQHRLEPPRLRLTREGAPVPPDSYLSFQTNTRKPGQSVPRLNATALTKHLREGSTLVLDAVDELQPPVTKLAESLERTFRVRVQVNAYAGWRTSHGFDLHWDDHDVFILQIAGRKHWKVYPMTRKYPLARDVEPAKDPPSEVLWEGMLEDGDLLYIPRGWWHVATPLDEPTLHLTVGVNNPTGADLMTWFADRLRSVEHVRRDIPHVCGEDEQSAFLDGLRQAFLNEWRPDLIQEFLADADAKAKPRPRLALPWSATAEGTPPGDWRMKWNGARNLRVSSNGTDGEIALSANGRRWRFGESARPLLELLVSGRELSLQELKAASNGTLDHGVVRAFVKELITNGLVVLC